jgi:hypothetical protein
MVNISIDESSPATGGSADLPPEVGSSGEVLWDEIRKINRLLGGRECDEPARADLAWRRVAAWERLTLLAIDTGDAPWYAAACACITEVATEAAERVAGRRRPRPLL